MNFVEKKIEYAPHSRVRYTNLNEANQQGLPELYLQRENCCGCTACYAVCPVKAISMETDEEGFLYPVVDAHKCIKCYKCCGVCALKEDQKDRGYLERGQQGGHGVVKAERELLSDTLVYAGRVKDDNTLMNSSSGGGFTALSDVFLRRGDAVVCSVYNYEAHKQEYRMIRTSEERDAARGSKYVQSIVGDIFSASEQWLKDNPDKRLLFVGTGCQAAGYISFTEQKGLRERVTVVDIICHGSPSPMIWKEHVTALEEKHGKIRQVSFKDKRNGWLRPTAVAVTEQGREVFLAQYKAIFYGKYILRPSCFKCPYTTTHRYTDITIGDFWHIEEKMPDFYHSNGNSLFLIHSQKGRELYERARETMEDRQSNVSDCWQLNLERPTETTPRRTQFWNDYFLKGIEYVMKKYSTDRLMVRIKRKIKKMLKNH